MSESVTRRKGEPSKRKGASDSLSHVNRLKAEYLSLRTFLKNLESNFEFEKSKENIAKSELKKLQDQLADVEEEINCDPFPEGAQPKSRIQRRDSLKIEISQHEIDLAAQKLFTKKAFDSILETERKLFNVDRQLHQSASALEDAQLAIKIQKDLDLQRVRNMARIEGRRADRWEEEREDAAEHRVQMVTEFSKLGNAQVDVASVSHNEALARIEESSNVTKSVMKQLNAQLKEKEASRAKSVVDLKHNLDAVDAVMKLQADRHVKKKQNEEKALAEQMSDMLSQGLNPYAEFRAKKLKKTEETIRSNIIDKIERDKTDLSVHLHREEETRRKTESAARRAEEYRKTAVGGRHIVEAKNSDYIRSITIGAKEILDPTGRALRVDPSQVTEIPDRSFGLGHSSRVPAATMEKVTESIRKKLGVKPDDFGEYQRFVQTYKKSNSADSSATLYSTSMEQEALVMQRMREQEFSSLAPQQVGPIPITQDTQLNGLDEDEEKLLLRLSDTQAMNENSSDRNESKLKVAAPHKYIIPVPSKLESDTFETKKIMQAQRLVEGQKQIAGGREFKGDSFVSKPAIIEFRDFEIGVTYTQRIILTNASYTFNSFSMLPLNDSIVDFFQISYIRPGRISAGMTCAVEIQFKPAVRSDIRSHIELLTETGIVRIPLNCHPKKCAPSVQCQLIDFGRVTVGQVIKQPLRITNSEALSTKFTILSEDPLSPSVEEDDELVEIIDQREIDASLCSSKEGEFSVPEVELNAAKDENDLDRRVSQVVSRIFDKKQKMYPRPISLALGDSEGILSGYAKATVTVTCAPLTSGVMTQRLLVQFDGVREEDRVLDADGKLVLKDQEVLVTCEAEALPIYLEEECVDFYCCLYDRIYRKKLTVCNSSNVSYRVSASLPSSYSGFIEVNPTVLFVQPKAAHPMHIRFTPSKDILSRLSKFSVRHHTIPEAALMKIPLKIEIANQELPVYGIIRTILSPSTLSITLPNGKLDGILDFGNVYVHHSYGMDIKVANLSLLPQKIAFVKLPREVSISPESGFGTLLPGEVKVFSVGLTLNVPIRHTLKFSLLTSLGDRHQLEIRTNGLDPPIKFDYSNIHLKATINGQMTVESVLATNTSAHPVTFEIGSPDFEYSWLRINPNVVTVEPNRTVRLEIEFCPPKDALSINPLEWEDMIFKKLRQLTIEETSKNDSGDDIGVTKNSDVASGVSSIKENRISDEHFFTWSEEDGWIEGRTMFGSVRWSRNREWGSNSEGFDASENNDFSEDQESKADVGSNTSRVSDINAGVLGHLTSGIVGMWKIPLFLKPRRPSVREEENADSSQPQFLSLRTTVVPPQFVILPEGMTMTATGGYEVNFGHAAIGTRHLRNITVHNLLSRNLQLIASGLNACGPFSVINYLREMKANGRVTVALEFTPTRNGIFIETLELGPHPNNKDRGQNVRITIRAEGVRPSLQLLGLIPLFHDATSHENLPLGWEKRSGLLDFEVIGAGESVVRKFKLLNKSKFAVDINITRPPATGLTPKLQQSFVETTALGLPIFTVKPELLHIAADSSAVIEVHFRPDRGRLLPFRDEFDISVCNTDEVVRFGVVGRGTSRQLVLQPADPRNEPFYRNFGVNPAAYVEELLLRSSQQEIRKAATDLASISGDVHNMSIPMVLEFPDPFVESFPSDAFIEVIEVDKTKGSEKNLGENIKPSRKQSRGLHIFNAKVSDGSMGTFEFIMSRSAIESGLFSVIPDKGPIPVTSGIGSEVKLDITCTLAPPKGIGGLRVGSWKNFEADVLLKGGWVARGEPEEVRIPIVLKAFVSL